MLDCRAAALDTASPPLRDSYAATMMPLPRCRIPILTVAGLIEIAALHTADCSVPPPGSWYLHWPGSATRMHALACRPKNRGPDQCAPVIRSAIHVRDR